MSPDPERLAEDLFQESLDRPAAERAGFLASRCSGNDDLRARVEDLLLHYAEAEDGFLEMPAVDHASADEPPPPDAIGPYRLLRVLGEGGMGTVYLAEQETPFRRKVALKIIKPGMDSREVVARFEAERQTLALMDHPGIARVFDAGTAESGRSYFVMEYVPGIPVTDYCDQERLDVRRRVELFIHVCEADQHAHQRGVIHRDLKPSNVLVTVEQGRVLPKVIDFGVAKATESDLNGSSFVTSHGQVVGTPEFMSPEQARLAGADVDTRTDVYSLGMLLYLLLTGALPFSPEELRALGLETMLRRIREDEPTRPSDRVTMAGHDLTGAARARRLTPERLPRTLRGDLDWIVMKALEKERDRRYGSVSTLAADLRCYLEEEPVSAGPPSASYRLRKFARRHRAAVGFAAAVVLLIMGFAGMMAYQAGRIARERDRANQEAAIARATSGFLFDLFEVSDPSRARGGNVTAREILDEGAARIGDRFADEPAVRARFQVALGRVYRSLGLYDEAEPLLAGALATQRKVLGDHHPETLDAVSHLAFLHWNAGRFDEAEALFRECLEGRRAIGQQDDPAAYVTMSHLGLACWSLGRYEEAESLQVRAVDGLTRALGPDDPEVLAAMNDLGVVYESQGRSAEAEELIRRVLDGRRRVLGEDHPETLTTKNNLGALAASQGRPREAERLWRETLAAQRRVLGDEHQETLRTMNNLTDVVEDPAEAEALHLRVVEISRATLGDAHAETLMARHNLGGFYIQQGRYDEAEPILLDVLAIRRRVLGEEHPDTQGSLHALGVLYRNAGRYDEALPYLTEVLETRRAVLGEDHPNVLRSMSSLGQLHALMGHDADAERLLAAAWRGRARVLGDEHPDTRASRERLVSFLESIGRGEDGPGGGS